MNNFPLEIGCTCEFMKIRIPYAGTYRITVRGAKAADGPAHTGGRGAIITASFYSTLTLTAFLRYLLARCHC